MYLGGEADAYTCGLGGAQNQKGWYFISSLIAGTDRGFFRWSKESPKCVHRGVRPRRTEKCPNMCQGSGAGVGSKSRIQESDSASGS